MHQTLRNWIFRLFLTFLACFKLIQIFDAAIGRNCTAFAWLVAQAQVSTMLKTRFAGGLSFASDGEFLKFGKYQCPESIEIAPTGLIATKIAQSVFWVMRDATVNTGSRCFQKSQLEGDFNFVLKFWPSLCQNIESLFLETGRWIHLKNGTQKY